MINSLITTIKVSEKELEKLETKSAELQKSAEDQAKLKEEMEKKLQELDDELALASVDEDLDKLKDELKELEAKAEPMTEEKNLIKEVDELKSKVGEWERKAKAFLNDINEIKSGTYNRLLAGIEIQDNPEENLKTRQLLAKNLKIERNNQGKLTVATIQRLIDACLQYYSKKFLILTHRERAERRKYVDQPEKWVETSLQLFEDIDKITDESQKEFLEYVGIDFTQFNNEVEDYCKQDNREVLIMMSMIPQKMKMMMKHQKDLNKEKVKEILKYQVTMILQEMPKLFPYLPRPDPSDPSFNPEKIALLITNRINDLIWKKFNCEEEDFIAAMKKPKIANDFEVNQIAMQIEMAMMQLAGGPMGGMPDDMMGGMGGFPGGGMGGMY